VKYLVDGFYIDYLTTEIKVKMLFYNAFYGHFTLVVTTFDFQNGGTITMDVSCRNFAATNYQVNTPAHCPAR